MFFIIILIIAILSVCLIIIYTEKRIQIYRKYYFKEHGFSSVLMFSLSSDIAKRLTDIFISVSVCLTILPVLYIVLGIIIKLTSAGPVIFSQERIGLFGKKFICYKFRSMYLNNSQQVATRNDKRVTPIGKFIRRTHLDEFPQFFNVLIGDMSVVGPRPMREFELNEFSSMPRYLLRFIFRPGITGLAQIHSTRLISRKRFLEYDIEYIQDYSWIKDMLLIFETLKFQDESY